MDNLARLTESAGLAWLRVLGVDGVATLETVDEAGELLDKGAGRGDVP